MACIFCFGHAAATSRSYLEDKEIKRDESYDAYSLCNTTLLAAGWQKITRAPQHLRGGNFSKSFLCFTGSIKCPPGTHLLPAPAKGPLAHHL